MALISESVDTRGITPPESLGSRIKKAVGPIGVIGVVILKFIAKIKFILPILLKTGGSMVLMVGVYASIWGWKWALGFVLLLLLHECGHLIVAKWFGLAVSAPMFIPFMGAFIALKEAPRNAWMEACVGIGGPILGSLAAAACHALGLALNYPLLIALGWSAYFLNLFSLTPVGMLDGGRIVSALSPWLWLPGFAALGWLAWTHPNFIVWILLFASLPRIVSLFRKRTEEEQRYYEVAPAQRWLMALMYFGLIGALVLGMHVSHLQLLERVDAARQKFEQTFPQAE
ncbi:MAG: site-2 protease family protein [Verrucomicrobia bacterium]|nr:MAG: site-2 protease family protein [Verrucomicrobiota bacterium]